MIYDDKERLAQFKALEETLMSALKEGNKEITFKLPVLAWLGLVEEIKDRHPRNMSRLIADDTADRLHAAIDRLDEEVAFLIVHGPASVASRFDPGRQRHKRDMASDNLKKAMREKSSR